ncbi:ATP-binding cassette domain-containing protein [Candidatus Nanohaloarchaea archaeon]|nr:ATP-binding cassette domain-containing protein [Candidatus Nanohaloarchaea archaeon]
MNYAIKTEDLSKIYSMGEVEVEALKDVSIDIEKGEFVSIMGPSGSGKSTLMHLIGLLDDPSSGEITVDGTNTSSMTEDEKSEFRLEKIGFVFQFYSLLKGFNSLEQVYLPLTLDGVPDSEAKERAREALEKVGLSDRMKHSPDELSGGQRQRVAVARALAGEPEILLADESTSQLDTEVSEKMMQLYRDLAEQGQTVITVNHEKELGKEADRVIWLEDGELSEFPEK